MQVRHVAGRCHQPHADAIWAIDDQCLGIEVRAQPSSEATAAWATT